VIGPSVVGVVLEEYNVTCLRFVYDLALLFKPSEHIDTGCRSWTQTLLGFE
jgi:hypothetical protein